MNGRDEGELLAMATPAVTVEVFCSYAHGDELWLRKLEEHLSPLKQQGVISFWYDRFIAPGTDRKHTIDTHLETASIILLLVSANFFASDYHYRIEMKRALERQEAGTAQVIPILIRPVDWKQAPFAHLRVLPTNAKPLVLWENKDAALADISENLRRIIAGEPHYTPHSTSRPVWNVPFARNPHFTGRDELLDLLHQQLTVAEQDTAATTRRVALTQPHAIKGLGGIGKTQIAVEYAYRSRDLDRYAHTLWINAATEETIITSFREIAKLLPSFFAEEEADQQKLVDAVKRWLNQCEQRWLLIFDNADDLSLVRNILPPLRSGNGSILLTTRASAVGSLAAVPIEVGNMGLIEGMALLLRRAQRLDHTSAEEQDEAINLVIALDAFPLALDQAGAYIEETQCSLADYLQIYHTQRKDLLARRGQTIHYPATVVTTWSLSFQKVEQANPAAADLLRLCAFLAPDKIPEELIRNGAPCWNPPLQQAASTLFTFNQMIEELLKFSLIKRLTEDQALSIHRMVQAVQKDEMEPGVQRQWAQQVIRAVNLVFPEDPLNIATWLQCLRYLDQVRECNELIKHFAFSFNETADLLSRTGIYLKRYAFDSLVEPLFLRALAIREQCLGADHRDTINSLSNLANLYLDQGRYIEAEELYKKIISMREKEAGPELAATLNSLALLYCRQGKFRPAETCCGQALALYEKSSEPEPAGILNTLAMIYQAQGRYAEAEILYLRALAIETKELGDGAS